MCSAGLEPARRHTGAARARAGYGSHQQPSTNKFGRRALGHIHDTGVAGLTLPREIHNRLISDKGEATWGWIRGGRELPYLGAGRRAGGRGTLPHELRARKRLRREEAKSKIGREACRERV